MYVLFLAIAVLIIGGVIVISGSGANRACFLRQTSKGVKSLWGRFYAYPLKVNQAGVIPIIFAISILLFPQMIVNLLAGLNSGAVSSLSGYIFDFS